MGLPATPQDIRHVGTTISAAEVSSRWYHNQRNSTFITLVPQPAPQNIRHVGTICAAEVSSRWYHNQCNSKFVTLVPPSEPQYVRHVGTTIRATVSSSRWYHLQHHRSFVTLVPTSAARLKFRHVGTTSSGSAQVFAQCSEAASCPSSVCVATVQSLYRRPSDCTRTAHRPCSALTPFWA
jgi:hypothetical protein